MANKKISELPLKNTPSASDIIPIVDTNAAPLATKKTTLANVLTALNILRTSNIGIPGGVAGLNVFGKIPVEQLPAIAVNDTFVVNSEAEMLALTAEIGDVAVRTDSNKSFILSSVPATSVNNWVELLASGIPATNQVDGGNF